MKILIFIYKILKRIFAVCVVIPLYIISIFALMVSLFPVWILTGENMFNNKKYDNYLKFLLKAFD